MTPSHIKATSHPAPAHRTICSPAHPWPVLLGTTNLKTHRCSRKTTKDPEMRAIKPVADSKIHDSPPGTTKRSPSLPASEYQKQSADFEREAKTESRRIKQFEKTLERDKRSLDALNRRGTQMPLTPLRGHEGLLAADALLEIQTQLAWLRVRFESSSRLALEYKSKAERWQELASNPAMIATRRVKQ